MPPPLNRFPSGVPYHQQFSSVGQQQHQQQSHGPPPMGAPGLAGPFQGPGANAFTHHAGAMLGIGGASSNALSSFASGLNDSTNSLASHAARISFAQAGAATHHAQHQTQQSHSSLGDHSGRASGARGRIREVWAHNLDEEFNTICLLAPLYPYVAVDVQFPGVVARPIGNFIDTCDYHYQCVRLQADALKVVQVGISLFNESGQTPQARTPANDPAALLSGRFKKMGPSPTPYTWQFNFSFSRESDMASMNAIENFQALGLDFSMLERDGIDPEAFAARLISSGLLLQDDVTWISFHGAYDLGFLTKLVTCVSMPKTLPVFDENRALYFPNLLDVKYLMKKAMQASEPTESMDILSKTDLKGGLDKAAEIFKLKRIGVAGTAGSDSLLTGKIFFVVRDRLFRGQIPATLNGKIWGFSLLRQPTQNQQEGESSSAAGQRQQTPIPQVNGHHDSARPDDNAGPNGVDEGTSSNAGSNGNDFVSGNGTGNNSTGNITMNMSSGVNGVTPSTPNTGGPSIISNNLGTPQQTQSLTGTQNSNHATNGLGNGPRLGSLTPGGGTGVFGGFNFGATNGSGSR